jgi:hypothetical protein
MMDARTRRSMPLPPETIATLTELLLVSRP